MLTSNAFQHVLDLIDAANAQDPNREIDSADGPCPKELLYGRRMSRCLAEIAPNASEELQIAVRAQHLQRWRIPRDDFSRDRSGYLQWRRKLGQFHAQRCGELMAQAGYDPTAIARVESLLQKKNLKTDPEAQTLEDVACLVFIQYYLSDFAPRYEPDKLIPIVQKTWKKMSSQAQQKALSLELPGDILALVNKALNSPS